MAGSNFDGMPVRKRASDGSRSMPMMESCGPVMPASVRYAVPFGRMRSSARLHVRVRADDERGLPVEMPAHRDLLAGRLGVEVHDDDAGLGRMRFDLAQDHREGIVDRRHEHAAHDVDDADRAAVARLRDDTSPGPARRQGSWPDAAGAARLAM